MDDPVDAIGPWTIKAVAKATRDKVTIAARREGLTVGQWLEKRVEEWEDAGSPVSVAASASPAPVNLGELAQAIEAARALASDAQVPVPPQLARDGLNLIRQAIRAAKGSSRRRKTPLALIESEAGAS